MKKWYEKSGPQADVVISTRVRLARNLPDIPFPARMTQQQRRQMEETVRQAVQHSQAVLEKPLHFEPMDTLSQLAAISLVERHLASPEFITQRPGRALFLSEDESVSVMVGEEDHVRIQVMQEGMELTQAYRRASALDDALNTSLHFAFDSRLGYLTQCPTNLGTGLRASLMLHLPALQEGGVLGRIAGDLSKLGLTLRGTYGEGSQAVGALYQLSNQVSLGLKEEEALANLQSIAMQIMEQERTARAELAQRLEQQDRIFRSLGILRSACVLSSEEFMKRISAVRMGVSTGLIPDISYDTIHTLIVQTQPATMMQNGRIPPAQRDALRAKLVKEALGCAAK